MENIERLRLAVDALRRKYHYDPETGLFHNRSTGQVIKGSLSEKHRGHLSITISLSNGKRTCLAMKKAVWLWCYGVYDERKYDIHHLDMDPQNQKLSNLVKLPREQHKALHSKLNQLLSFVRESIELTGELPEVLRNAA
ncbi:HNH endonuclease [Escherichia coli]|uniref:HNH endonuclease n=1 Tax=Escherichia coli TaxID=562 RepID=UPI0013239F9D|nr:HNH endonuclease [Escherichia coli]MWM86271.1 HNH endonuclease [Escherichia coli]